MAAENISKAMGAIRCYVCGQAIAVGKFVLATMSEETDRVFTLHEKCAKQLEDGTHVIPVRSRK